MPHNGQNLNRRKFHYALFSSSSGRSQKGGLLRQFISLYKTLLDPLDVGRRTSVLVLQIYSLIYLTHPSPNFAGGGSVE